MYTLIRESLPFGAFRTSPRGRGLIRPVGSTVVLLGLTSLLTDISSEMVTTVLPLYFIFHVGLTPISFGIIDGLTQGISAPLRILGGFLSDKLRLHKETATAGYGISAACKLGLFAFGAALLPFVLVLLLDRAGKGLRTAPRDAMISLNSPKDRLGTAFGVHRAMDTAGALAGPLVAFALLSLAPGAFDMIFVVSFCVALMGVSVIGLLVESARGKAASDEAPPPSAKEAIRLLWHPYVSRVVVVAGALSLFTIGDGFFYVVLQQRLDLDYGFFPLLYVGTACAYFLLAVPAGMLADRVGRMPVFAGGYVLLLLAYTALLRPAAGPAEVAFYLILFGAYYAATDGVLMAMVSANIAPQLRASSLALVTTVTSLGRFGASVLFGLLWTWQSESTAIAVLLGGLSISTLAVVLLLRERSGRDGDSGREAASLGAG